MPTSAATGYGWTVPLSMAVRESDIGPRDMRPSATNQQTGARDAHQLKFAPAGVPLPVTNTQGKPLHRLSVLPSLGPVSHVPPPKRTRGSDMHKRQERPFAAFIGIDWADK